MKNNKTLVHKTFDNRKDKDMMFELSNEDHIRQSYAHAHDYSFGTPTDFNK